MTEKTHFIGIGGIGMSGLARILLNRNMKVTGSDITSSPVTENLIKEGADVFIGHSATHIDSSATVVFSTDIKHDNPEYQAALNFKCTMLHRSDLLAKLMQGSKTLAVTGTHGKTTTSSLLTAVLVHAGLDPSFAVGGIIPQLGSNAGAGKGEHFVAEADESDGTFLKYTPFGAIVTNIDLDHMDHFKTEETLLNAFKTFIGKVEEERCLFWCKDDKRLAELKPRGLSYGFDHTSDLRILSFAQKGWSTFFNVTYKDRVYVDIALRLIGKHNVLNAAAIFGLCLELGVKEESIREAMAAFGGILRRCEKKDERSNVLFLDDYGHHPTEIKTTLNGIKNAIGERRLVVVFQPHRYTRTRDCLGAYKGIFDDADELFVTDIYGAGETAIEGISPQLILKEVKAHYAPRNQLAQELAQVLRPHDVVVTLGAGDITKLVSEMKEYPIKKIKIGIVFGGRSTEHEVSLHSATYVLASLRPDLYEIKQFGISKQGVWMPGEDLFAGKIPENSTAFSPKMMEALNQCDVFFPVLHGPFGEDGTIQGFFEMLGKAYVGCDYRSAMIAMDKDLTKKMMILSNVMTSPFVAFNHYQWKQNPQDIVECVLEQLQWPMFVKPVHLGSSVGVSKVENESQLLDAIENAFSFDNKILVENGLVGREIEFAVLGNDEIRVFSPGEICTGGQFYDYAAKYGEDSMTTSVQADLPIELIDQGRQLAAAAYQAAECTGMARVDFFLDREGNFWLNEINPIPGFTKKSLYPKMCEVNGLKGSELIDRLIILANQKERLKRKYECVL